MTADALIGQLVGAGVLTDSITVQNFEETEEEGQYVLKLDLSSNFKDSVRSMGTAGEILTIGAVVNSFLDTFQAEAIQITVDGGTLETGHIWIISNYRCSAGYIPAAAFSDWMGVVGYEKTI